MRAKVTPDYKGTNDVLRKGDTRGVEAASDVKRAIRFLRLRKIAQLDSLHFRAESDIFLSDLR